MEDHFDPSIRHPGPESVLGTRSQKQVKLEGPKSIDRSLWVEAGGVKGPGFQPGKPDFDSGADFAGSERESLKKHTLVSTFWG